MLNLFKKKDPIEPFWQWFVKNLGEYDCALSVRRYGFRDMSEAEDQDSLRPLGDLPAFVDDFHRNRLN